MNFIYSATAFCTSIVAQDINGTILHGRNLDYPIPVRDSSAEQPRISPACLFTDAWCCVVTLCVPQGLQNVTALIEFQQGGATKYYGTAFVGECSRRIRPQPRVAHHVSAACSPLHVLYTGYVGLLTGMKPGVFSVSIDQRDVKYSNPLEGPLLNLYSALEVHVGAEHIHKTQQQRCSPQVFHS